MRSNSLTCLLLFAALSLGVIFASGCDPDAVVWEDQADSADSEADDGEPADDASPPAADGQADPSTDSREDSGEDASQETGDSREGDSKGGGGQGNGGQGNAGQSNGDGKTTSDDAAPDGPAGADGSVDGKTGGDMPIAAVDKSSNPQLKPGDWPQWGGSSYRNNVPVVPDGVSIPTQWDVGGFDRKTGEWKKDESENIKWVAAVGSQTYGNPVVSHGRVYIGTNNGAGHLKRYPADIDLGCLLCFSEKDGSLLWQHSNEKLITGRVHDWPLQGVCSAAYAEEDRLWYVSNRGHVVCLDPEGFHDGEDDGDPAGMGRLFDEMKSDDDDKVAPAVAALNEGKVNDWLRGMLAERGMPLPDDAAANKGEKANTWTIQAQVDGADRKLMVQLLGGSKLSAFKQITSDDKNEADVIWTYDMMSALKTSQHNMCSCSVTALGDILFVNTSNGLDETHINLPAPNAPSFFAMDKNDGTVYWTDKSPGTNILHGQWSSPTVGMIQGEPQVIFGGGDGWVYSFKADKGADGKPTLLWKFDANPKTSGWVIGGRGTRNNLIATPVIYDGLVYVAVGQDPEHGEGIGHLWCIDPTKSGDISPTLAMKVEGDKRTPIPHKRIQAVIPEAGEVEVDNPNSGAIWHYSEQDQNGDGEIDFEETMHRSCGTVAIKDDLLYISDFSGLFHCLDAKTGKVHWTYDMLAAAWGSPLIVGGHVYIGDEDGDLAIFKLSAEPQEPIEELNMDNSLYTTPIVANGVLFIANKTHLFAIQEEGQAAE